MKNSHMPEWNHSTYLWRLIPTDKLKNTARLAKRALAKYNYDALACRGVSGLLIAPLLACRLNKSLLVVRKPSEDNLHTTRTVEGDQAARRYIIIDDFMSSGETVNAIQEEIGRFAPQAVCLGLLEVNKLYSTDKREVGPPEKVKLRTDWMGPYQKTPDEQFVSENLTKEQRKRCSL